MQDYKHVISMVDVMLCEESDIKGLEEFIEWMDDIEVKYTIHAIDHHESVYAEILKDCESDAEIEYKMYNLDDYIEYFKLWLEQGFENGSIIHYCYDFSESISACKMVYDIWKSILVSIDCLDDTVFAPSHSMAKIIAYVSDYDTGTYKVKGSKEFIWAFYNEKLNLNVMTDHIPLSKAITYKVNSMKNLGKKVMEDQIALVRKVIMYV